MKKLIPARARVHYQLIKRYLIERLLKRQNFALYKTSSIIFDQQRSHQQEIKMSNSFANKVHNIDLCIKQINHLVIAPQQMFSFWQLIPEPCLSHGFKTGRNLVNGQIREDIGGGICQVSGIIYINALKTGFQLLERHSHSIDIYQEHERFTPLGSDATVVYGYKDLQFKNPYDFPIQIVLERLDQQLMCHFYSPEPLPDFALKFDVEHIDTTKHVSTYVNQIKVAHNIYKAL